MRRPRKVVFGMHNLPLPLPSRVFPILEIQSVLRLYNRYQKLYNILNLITNYQIDTFV